MQTRFMVVDNDVSAMAKVENCILALCKSDDELNRRLVLLGQQRNFMGRPVLVLNEGHTDVFTLAFIPVKNASPISTKIAVIRFYYDLAIGGEGDKTQNLSV